MRVNFVVRFTGILNCLLGAQLCRYQVNADGGINTSTGTHSQRQIEPEIRIHFLSPRYMRSPMMKAMDAPDRSSKTESAAGSTCASVPIMVESRMAPTAT